MRRIDGSSVYSVAGSELFTSARILAAEQRLVVIAGRTDGPVLDAGTVELALLESARKRERFGCWSGRSGSFHVHLRRTVATRNCAGWRRKDHAMRSLVRAWTDGGGHVVGLAPSAAAAAQLRDATGAPAETSAKLTWSIRHADLPDWADLSAGPRW